MKRSRRFRSSAALLAATALALSSCAESQRDDSDDESDGSGGGGTFVFAGSAEPVSLDPFFASDGESFRVARQIFEGLVSTEEDSADPAPGLAETWEVADDGLSYTFNLREGVTFQDDTPFDAEAVCYNFDRWYNMPESAQNDEYTYYYGTLFRGFATGDRKDAAVFDSCTADDELTATIKLKAPFAGFISAMSMPAFSMQSPTALEKWQDDGANNPRTTDYSTAHPVGTGPFVFDSWERGDRLTLKRYDDYWGEKAIIDTAVIVPIDDSKARADALRNGEIDAFDLVGPADVGPLESEGFQIQNREPFNILYLGMNQKQAPLDDLKVRQAIAHAIDKEAVISASMPEGTQPALEFIPPTVNGYTEDVATYDYDPDRARDLLEQAGAEGATIEFNYPTGVSRPYMPQPEDTFNVIRSQLAEVGLKIKPTADVWDPDYLEKIQGTSDHGIHLLGWTGDYNDTDNFLGVFFGGESSEWGFDNPELFDALREARGLPTVEEQTPAYEEINKMVMDFLPGVPIASPVPSLGLSPDVSGYEASPVQNEVWNTVSID
ncbi:ABC transporter substrate-binding protein [Nocardioides ferulae]|uniref:ABC transporter substrate-binding protein n=1 Tax=Nocardioides ferulae TaxID=2340821 RepID=UPI000EB5B6F6|nr:ABC transporter substrate-binding protein [Nocardioides ferulae]